MMITLEIGQLPCPPHSSNFLRAHCVPVIHCARICGGAKGNDTPYLALKISLPGGEDRDLNQGLPIFFQFKILPHTQERLPINGLVWGVRSSNIHRT